MQTIYTIRKTSTAYDSNEHFYSYYYLCDTEDEYQKVLKELHERRNEIVEQYHKAFKGCDESKVDIYSNLDLYNIKYRYDNTRISEEKEIHADFFCEGRDWQGKRFDAFGFNWWQRNGNTTTSIYFLKPGSVGEITECTDPGIGWMYGS